MAITERERLEGKITHLCNLARRYSVYDPKYLSYHAQIDEALDAWQFAVATEGEDTEPVDGLV